MLNRYLNTIGNHKIGVAILIGWVVLIGMVGGMVSGDIQHNPEVEQDVYEITKAGDNIDTQGSVYTYENLNESQQQTLTPLFNGNEKVSIERNNSTNPLPKQDFTLVKDNTAFLVNHTPDSNVPLWFTILLYGIGFPTFTASVWIIMDRVITRERLRK